MEPIGDGPDDRDVRHLERHRRRHMVRGAGDRRAVVRRQADGATRSLGASGIVVVVQRAAEQGQDEGQERDDAQHSTSPEARTVHENEAHIRPPHTRVNRESC
jgi:hypothetical protein